MPSRKGGKGSAAAAGGAGKGKTGGGNRRGGGGKRRGAEEEEDTLPSNEVDDFMAQRDKVRLSRMGGAGAGGGDDDDDEDDDEENEFQGREVMSLKGGDDDDDDENEQDLYEKKLQRIDKQSSAWGKNRRAYYDADTKDFEIESDDEIAKEEEAEAIR